MFFTKDFIIQRIGVNILSQEELKNARLFGLLIAAVLLIIAALDFYKNKSFSFVIVINIFLLSTISIFSPKYLVTLSKIWINSGLVLGKIFSPLILSLIFFLVIFPFGIVIKILRVDFLREGKYKNKKSFWINRTDQPGSMENQF